jgi:purine nucleosidase
MGTDDAVALCMLLFDDRFDVVGIAASEGCVAANQANKNLQAILTLLDPARYPRVGMATPVDCAPPVDTRFLYGNDGLGNSDFDVSILQNAPASEKLIIDTVRANPDEVTILCLGPLTNLARAIRRDPHLVPMIDRVIVAGGSLTAQGNITQAAEFNFYFDPQSAREVLKSRMTTFIVPLDITQDVKFGMAMINDLPRDSSRVGDFLRKTLPFTFRAYRQQLGLEQIVLNDAVGALALLEPQLFEFEAMGAEVETEGMFTRGVLVLDRRERPEWRHNVDVAVSIQSNAAQYIVDQLTLAGQKSR